MSRAVAGRLALQDEVAKAAQELLTLLKAAEWTGWDPYDALLSPAAPRLLAAGTPLARVFTQAVKRSPIGLRAVLAIPQTRTAATLGYTLQAYGGLGAVSSDDATVDKSEVLLLRQRAMRSRVTSDGHSAWGLPFAFASRFGVTPQDRPNVVTT